MNNREKAKAVQKKFNQRLGIYYGVMAAGAVVAAIGLMTKINVLTRLGVVAFFAGLVILSWVDGYTGYAKRVMTAKVLMGEEMPELLVSLSVIGTVVFVVLGGLLSNVVFVVLGVACVVLYVVIAVVYDSNKDFDMLASYIEYASTHEVNEEYRNSCWQLPMPLRR